MSSTQKFETIQHYEFAIRRYKQIVPDSLPPGSRLPIHDLQVWLSDDVSPVVEDFAKRPTFREFASWPLRALADGADTPERRCIREIDAAFVAFAKTLFELSTDPSIHRKLVAQNPPRPMVSSETFAISANETALVAAEQETVDVLSLEIAQVAAISQRPWTDLVSVEDYFEPRQEWNETNEGSHVQRSELIVSLNPELHALGNFIVRCLRQRVDGLYEILAALRRKHLAAIAGDENPLRLPALHRQWELLEAQKAKLYELCFTGQENVVRDSCIILAQVYAAFHVKPDLQWLGLPSAVVQEGIGVIRTRLQQFQNAEMLERISAALGDLPRLYDDGAPDLSARDEAIASDGLVVDMQRAEVYWKGKSVAGPWKGLSWKFLVALAKKARLRSYIGESDVFADVKANSTMATTCSRLKQKLPMKLGKLIGPASNPRSYRLDLEPYRIYIFENRR